MASPVRVSILEGSAATAAAGTSVGITPDTLVMMLAAATARDGSIVAVLSEGALNGPLESPSANAGGALMSPGACSGCRM